MATTTHRAGRKAGQGSKWIRPAKRLAIYLRDSLSCVYCGKGIESGAQLTLDHVVACELGGTNHETNLVTCCDHCNSAKQAKTLRAWYRALRTAGLDTTTVARRVRRLTSRPPNIAAAKAIMASRTETSPAAIVVAIAA